MHKVMPRFFLGSFHRRSLRMGRLLAACLLLTAAFVMLWSGHAQAKTDVSLKILPYPEDAPRLDKRAAILCIIIEPDRQSYIYGPESKSGLPTKVAGRIKKTADAADFVELAVFSPAPVAKGQSAAAHLSPPGVNDKDSLIYDGPAVFLTLIPLDTPEALLEISVSGLACTASSCMPFKKIFGGTLGELLSENNYGDPGNAVSASGYPWRDDFYAWVKAKAPDFFGSGRHDGRGGEAPLPGSDESADNANAQALLRILPELTPRYHNPSLEVGDLGTAILFGILAGLLLNLMPCVLPVISLKFSALLSVSAMVDKEEQARRFREHCLIFGLGIVVWFLVLAVLLGTAGLAWGEMFQSPYVVTGLIFLLFLLGLSLFGVFTLPVLDLKFSGSRHPRLQAFMGGLLATLLATPCSGPLLGGVLGWALRQPLSVLIISVFFVGVGMALPYGVLALFPGLVRLLPKPGAWTLRLEQLLSFFLMASVVYLISLLPPEWVTLVLTNLVIVAVAAWLWGQIGDLTATFRRKLIARILAVIIVVLGIWWASTALDHSFAWEKFNAAEFSERLGKEPMLLEFTADWCPSCKAMESTTLSDGNMRERQAKYKFRAIRVDLTRNAELEQQLLKTLGSISIPVMAIFPAGDGARSPLVLRDIVTSEQLDEALAETLGASRSGAAD